MPQAIQTMTSYLIAILLAFAIMAFEKRAKAADLEYRIGVYPALQGAPIADIIYVHGYADRYDNHIPLFNSWNALGFRVISFDLPSHGMARGKVLDHYGFSELARLFNEVELKTLEDKNRPLILAGWSTGGLLVTRILQAPMFFIRPSRPIQAAILFTPGVSVHKIVGKNGYVTEDTLTSNPNVPHLSPPKPTTPFAHPVFAGYLLFNSYLAQTQMMPADIPVLTFVADQKLDLYADSQGIVDWVNNKRRENQAPISAVYCHGGKHELDNEIEPIAQDVRNISAQFLMSVMAKSSATQKEKATPNNCVAF